MEEGRGAWEDASGGERGARRGGSRLSLVAGVTRSSNVASPGYNKNSTLGSKPSISSSNQVEGFKENEKKLHWVQRSSLRTSSISSIFPAEFWPSTVARSLPRLLSKELFQNSVFSPEPVNHFSCRSDLHFQCLFALLPCLREHLGVRGCLDLKCGASRCPRRP